MNHLITLLKDQRVITAITGAAVIVTFLLKQPTQIPTAEKPAAQGAPMVENLPLVTYEPEEIPPQGNVVLKVSQEGRAIHPDCVSLKVNGSWVDPSTWNRPTRQGSVVEVNIPGSLISVASTGNSKTASIELRYCGAPWFLANIPVQSTSGSAGLARADEPSPEE